EITHDRIFTDKPLDTFPWLKHYSNRIDIGQGVYARDILQRKLTR
ncbi:MAG: hypothetical protein K0R83_2745, partial [Caulobacter sp.]|nr:hypothetical protein [Caulobacter sp.]